MTKLITKLTNKGIKKFFFIKFLNQEERDLMYHFLQRQEQNLISLFQTEKKYKKLSFKKSEEMNVAGFKTPELYLYFYVDGRQDNMTVYSLLAWIAFQSNYRLEIDKHNVKQSEKIKIAKNAVPPTTGSENPYSIPIIFENNKIIKISVNHFLQNTDSISVNLDGIITKKNSYNIIFYYLISFFFDIGPNFNQQRIILKKINHEWSDFQLKQLKISSSKTYFSY